MVNAFGCLKLDNIDRHCYFYIVKGHNSHSSLFLIPAPWQLNTIEMDSAPAEALKINWHWALAYLIGPGLLLIGIVSVWWRNAFLHRGPLSC